MVRLLLILCFATGLSVGQTKPQDHFDEYGCNTTFVGVKACADEHKELEEFQRKLDLYLHPRDLFRCDRLNTCDKPIRGWSLSFKSLMIVDGSLDIQTYLVTGTKGKEKQYFWMEFEGGVDPSTDQSLSSVRVKKLQSPGESPYETDEMRIGLWAPDRSIVWMPGSKDDPNHGSCISYPLTNVGMSEFPVTKEECAARKEKEVTYTAINGKFSHPVRGKRVQLVPWKQTDGSRNICK